MREFMHADSMDTGRTHDDVREGSTTPIFGIPSPDFPVQETVFKVETQCIFESLYRCKTYRGFHRVIPEGCP